MPAAGSCAVEAGPRPISEAEFTLFRRFIYEQAGITLAGSKAALVSGRLGKRLVECGCASFGEYHRLLASGQDPQERQRAVDLLTTNETYFFRETRHFEFLREQAQAARARGGAMRVWSAAGSSGEEAYSIAMVLADVLGGSPWEVLATDISRRVLEQAACGLYRRERARQLPPAYLQRFCLKGTEEHAGQILVDRALRARVRFGQVNLNAPLPELGRFDIVFLRNVLIYFNDETKRQVVARVAATVEPGGYLLAGHSESLNGIAGALQIVAPSIYRRPT